MVLPQNCAVVARRQDINPQRRAGVTTIVPAVAVAVLSARSPARTAKTRDEDLNPTAVQQSNQKAVQDAVRERVQEIMNEAGDS